MCVCVCVCVSMPAGIAQQSSGAVSKSRWPGLPSLISLMVPVAVKQHSIKCSSELRSCVKVEVDVLCSRP